MIEVGSVTYSDRLKRMATEAQLLLAQYVFETLKYRRYEWKCDSLNRLSRNAAAAGYLRACSPGHRTKGPQPRYLLLLVAFKIQNGPGRRPKSGEMAV